MRSNLPKHLVFFSANISPKSPLVVNRKKKRFVEFNIWFGHTDFPKDYKNAVEKAFYNAD